jgi:hypothetical protein
LGIEEVEVSEEFNSIFEAIKDYIDFNDDTKKIYFQVWESE